MPAIGVTRRSGRAVGDGTARPCSDPECRSGGFTQGRAVMTRPSPSKARITGSLLIRHLRYLCQERIDSIIPLTYASPDPI